MKDPPIPEMKELKTPDSTIDLIAETQWCQHVCDVISEQKGPYKPDEEAYGKNNDHVSWAAYHANQQKVNNSQTANSALLPLFPDDPWSVAMIKHALDVVKKAVNIPIQQEIPVIACDQPLYKNAKDIQWTWQIS